MNNAAYFVVTPLVVLFGALCHGIRGICPHPLPPQPIAMLRLTQCYHCYLSERKCLIFAIPIQTLALLSFRFPPQKYGNLTEKLFDLVCFVLVMQSSFALSTLERVFSQDSLCSVWLVSCHASWTQASIRLQRQVLFLKTNLIYPLPFLLLSGKDNDFSVGYIKSVAVGPGTTLNG